MRNLLTNNSTSGIIQFVLTALLTFIAIPIFIKYLGIERYGIFALLAILGNFQVFADLGLTTALIKFIAEQGKVEESNYDIFVNFAIISIISAVIATSLLFLSHPILIYIFQIPVQYYSEAKILYLLLILSNIVLLIGLIFKSIIDAEQKIYISNYLQLIYSFIYWGLIVLVVLIGYKLVAIGVVCLIAAVLWFVGVCIYAIRLWGKFGVNNLKTNFFRVAKKQISYGSKLYVSYILSLLYEPLTLILISNLIGIKEVGFFDIAIRIKRQFVNLINKIFYPIYPYISKISDINKIRNVIHDVSQKTFYFVIPLVSIIFFCTESFVELWIGNDVEIISISIISITCSYLMFNEPVVPNYYFLIAKGYAIKNIFLQITCVSINTIFILTTYMILNYYSILIGNVLAIFGYFILSSFYQKKYLNSLFFDSITQLVKAVILFLALISTGFILVYFSFNAWINMVIIPTSLFLTSITIIRFFKIISSNDVSRYLNFNIYLSNFAHFLLVKKNS